MLNSVSIMGRLTREPELRYTQSSVPVCTVGLAIQRDFADSNGVRDADFIDVVFWRHNADFVARYMHKGQLVAVTGRIRTRYWQDSYDQRRTAVEIEAEHVYFAEKTDGGTAPAQPRPDGAPRRGPREDLKQVDDSRADVEYDGDLYRLPASDFAGLDDEDDPF